MTTIDSLTDEQTALIKVYYDEALKVGFTTGVADRELAKQAVERAYKWIGFNPPNVVFASGPTEGIAIMAEHLKKVGKAGNNAKVSAWETRWCWGQCEISWVTWLTFAIDVAGVEVKPEQRDGLQIWEDLAKSCYMVFSDDDLSVVVDHPTAIHFNAENQLHSVDGPALAFADGTKLFSVNGVSLDPDTGADIISGNFKPKSVLSESNAEVRRVMVDAYDRAHGKGHWIQDVGAQVVDSDMDQYDRPRRLLRVELEGDEDYLAIELTNSTPEPDSDSVEGRNLWFGPWKRFDVTTNSVVTEQRGFKKYTIRCHPQLRPLMRAGGQDLGEPQPLTCKNAVASLHGKVGSSYKPSAET